MRKHNTLGWVAIVTVLVASQTQAGSIRNLNLAVSHLDCTDVSAQFEVTGDYIWDAGETVCTLYVELWEWDGPFNLPDSMYKFSPIEYTKRGFGFSFDYIHWESFRDLWKSDCGSEIEPYPIAKAITNLGETREKSGTQSVGCTKRWPAVQNAPNQDCDSGGTTNPPWPPEVERAPTLSLTGLILLCSLLGGSAVFVLWGRRSV